jgi:hypothetical protein
MPGTPSTEITLGLGDGEIAVPVYERSVPYVLNRVGRFLDELQHLGTLDTEANVDSLIALLGGQTYGALCALIPNLPARMPEHAFRGYASEAAMAAGDFDEDAAERAPSMRQIREAFQAAVTVHGLDFLGLVKQWADPQILRPAINVRVAEWISGTSLSSPSENGATTPAASGASSTSQPTSSATALEASPA